MDADLRAAERAARETPHDLAAIALAERAAARAGAPPSAEVAASRSSSITALASAFSRILDKRVDLTGVTTPCCNMPVAIQGPQEFVSTRRWRGERALVCCRLRARAPLGGWKTGCGRALVIMEREQSEPWPENKSVMLAMNTAHALRYTPTIRAGGMNVLGSRTGRMSGSEPNMQSIPPWRTVCTGEHYGTGEPGCPREKHHHHDGRGDCVGGGGIERRGPRRPGLHGYVIP